MKNRMKQNGFTLVELMVVAIIVAILAAVAIPLMSAQKKRAAATEGEAGLGVMRSAMRANFAESGSYSIDARDQSTIVAPVTVTASNMPGVNGSDLNGRYFQMGDYQIFSVSANAYVLRVTGSTTDVAGVSIDLDQAGNFVRRGL